MVLVARLMVVMMMMMIWMMHDGWELRDKKYMGGLLNTKLWKHQIECVQGKSRISYGPDTRYDYE
jgi:hypothetical protein